MASITTSPTSGALVHIQEGEAVTTSLTIAEGTKVSHDTVIKLVRNYRADLEAFGPLRFEIRVVDRPQGGGSPGEYALLNEQQSALVIAYMRNSEIVRAFKIALVKGFYEMRAKLASPVDSLAELPPEQRALVALMVDNAKIKAQQNEIIATQETQAESIKRLEVKQSAFEDGVSYFTVIGYGAMHGIKVDNATAVRIGKRAGQLSKRQGISIGKVRDVRFGQVNSYHESILDAAFIEAGGVQ